MQPSDPTSSSSPKPGFRPCIGDIIAQKLTKDKAACSVVLNIYEDILGERVYLIQSVWRLVDLKKPELVGQTVMDNLGFFLATRQAFQSEYQEISSWYLRRREELYQAISPFVEDTPSTGHTRPIMLDVSSLQLAPMFQYIELDLYERDQPGRNFRPCVGDILMRSVEPNKGGCAVVLNILENALGDRVYHLQTTLGLSKLKGPEQLTQAQLDGTTYHLATREDFHEALQGYYDWYQEARDELYEAVKPFVENTGETPAEESLDR